MQHRQINLPRLALAVELRQRTARVRVTEGARTSWSFRLIDVEDLTVRNVPDLLAEARKPGKPLLVHFDRASPQARSLLREERVSFFGGADSCFLFSPPLIVDSRLDLPAEPYRSWSEREERPVAARNPFGRSASRVLRWLLLHPEERFGMRALAEETQVSETLVSRVVRAMDDEAWVEVGADSHDRRARTVRMRRPREALSAWARSWDRRRMGSEYWSIRAEGQPMLISRLSAASRRAPELRWAVGGVAGAHQMRRAVEPGAALLWVSRHDVDGLAKTLRPRRVARAEAQVRVMVAPDDYVFRLAWKSDGLPVADPVQLWLDCHGEGERALEAADAVAEEMGW